MDRPRKILRDNIHSITDTMIRKFAKQSGITQKYNLSSEIFDEFRNWAFIFLKQFCKNNAETKTSRYFLDPKDINFDNYDFDKQEIYDQMIHSLPFKRLIIECFQNAEIFGCLFSKEGLHSLEHQFCDKSIDFFTRVMQHKDNTDQSKLVSLQNIKDIRQTYYNE